MSSINFMGSYSGIDRTTIDKLMEVERLPLANLTRKKTDIVAKQNAWKDINTRLNTLSEKMKALQNEDLYHSKKVTSTNEKYVNMIVSGKADQGSYTINVESLASPSSFIGNKISVEDIKTNLNLSGSFTIENQEGVSFGINIEESDSLSQIVSKINKDSNTTGIRATIIDKRLVLEYKQSGPRNILIDGDLKDGLGFGVGSTEVKGSEAIFTINGIKVNRSSNIISDVIEGASIHLKNKHDTGQSETVKIEMNYEKTSEAVKDFVSQYNSTMSFIEQKMAAGNPDVPGSKGDLAGDNTLKRLQSSLRQIVTSHIPSNEGTSITEISAVGVSTSDRFGVLKFDEVKFKEQMELNVENVKNFFSNVTETEKNGFTYKINNYIDSFVSKKDGIIKGKADSFERGLKDIETQIKNFNLRVEKKEQYYVKMFSALDVAMMKAESQMEWLSGQIAAMNGQSRK